MKDINKWGLFNSLISIINDGAADDVNVTIARYLLENYNRLNDLNIYDIAEACFVSRATIRRMAQSLGFENFKAMKGQFGDFSDYYSFYSSGIGIDSAGRSMAEQVCHMMSECEKYLSEERLEAIVSQMYRSRQIVFVCSDVYSRQSSEFQKAMILAGKMVRVVSNKFNENSVLASLTSEDMLIVISVSSFFANLTLPMVKELPGYKILTTTVRDKNHESCYDEIWYLSDTPQVQQRSVYTIYAIQYHLEKISAAYIKKYGNKVKD